MLSFTVGELKQTFYLHQPSLYEAVTLRWVYRAIEWHLLILGRLHGGDYCVRVEGQLRDALETLLEMRLHSQRVLCL